MPTRSPRPPMPRAARFVLWGTGAFALLLLFAPALYVVKYYGGDKQREDKRAASASLSVLPMPDVNTLAPPLAPVVTGNAAPQYAHALQSYATRTAGLASAPPSLGEAQDVLDGARRSQCRFFGANLPAFHDPQGGQTAYTFPVAPDEKMRYLSAAVRLAAGMAASASPPQRETVGRALVRFGDSLGRERATRLHLAASTAVERIGLRLFAPTPALQKYVDARQVFDDRVQAKYAQLEPQSADNLLLQTRVAQQDADPLWRREGVWAAEGTLSVPRFAWTHPLEAVDAKATLAAVASHDIDPSVRACASDALAHLAQHGGAIIRR